MVRNNQLSGYELSRQWFDFCLENPELISPAHTALYFFCIDHCNRLGWREKFGLPTAMAMNAIGVKTWRTYSQALCDLERWKFVTVIEKSKNQYCATVIAIDKKAVAQQKHKHKQSRSTVKSKAEAEQKQSSHNKTSINLNKHNKPNKHLFDLNFVDQNFLSIVEDWLEYKSSRRETYKSEKSIRAFYSKLVKFSSNQTDTARQIIDESMANNWAGIFELKPTNQPTNQPPQDSYVF